MPLGYAMHVPSVCEIYLGQGTSICNPGNNHVLSLCYFGICKLFWFLNVKTRLACCIPAYLVHCMPALVLISSTTTDSDTWPRAKVYFTDTGNMHFMPLGYAMHVPNVCEIYLGQGTSMTYFCSKINYNIIIIYHYCRIPAPWK